MKAFHKLFSSVLALTMMIGLLAPVAPAFAAAADLPSPSIAISQSSAQAGTATEFNVTVTLPQVTNLACAASTRVNFDANAFELVEINVNNAPAAATIQYTDAESAAQCGFANCLFTGESGDNELDFSAGTEVVYTFASKASASAADYTFSIDPEYTVLQYFDEDALDCLDMMAASTASVDFSIVAETTPIETVSPRFTVHNLTLTGLIGANFFMELPESEYVDWTTSYMTFEVMGETITDEYDATHKNASGKYFGFTCPMSAFTLADPIHATFHYVENGEEKTLTQDYDFSAYLASFTEEQDGAKTFGLISSICDYCYYSQLYLSKHASAAWTLGTDHIAMGTHYAEPSDYAAEVSSILNAISGEQIQRTLNADISRVSYSLNLESGTDINLYITPASGYTGPVSATVNGEAAELEKTSNGRYKLTIANIPGHELMDDYNVVITTNGGTSTVVVSAMSYVYTCLNDPLDESETNAMAAIYKYYVANMNYRK